VIVLEAFLIRKEEEVRGAEALNIVGLVEELGSYDFGRDERVRWWWW
jgi:hypothetical protein